MEFKKQLLTHNQALKVSYGTGNTKEYLTIHQTANTRIGANAKSHADLQSRGFDYGWHWQVDDKEAIQSIEHKYKVWHAGDGKGPGNTTSIGVEICINRDGDYSKSVENGARLAAKILKDENIPITKMVQHNRWTGKNCPAQIRDGKNGITWALFVAKVKRYLAELNGSTTKVPTIPKTESKPASDELIRVQVGAFVEEENADKLIADLDKLGYDAFKVAPATSLARKSEAEVAADIALGKNGWRGVFGEERRKKLEALGYDYARVQSIVNKIV